MRVLQNWQIFLITFFICECQFYSSPSMIYEGLFFISHFSMLFPLRYIIDSLYTENMGCEGSEYLSLLVNERIGLLKSLLIKSSILNSDISFCPLFSIESQMFPFSLFVEAEYIFIPPASWVFVTGVSFFISLTSLIEYDRMRPEQCINA